MKVVFDTVILVRGLIGPYSVWGKLIFEAASTYEWIVSQKVTDEYLEVLHRPELLRKYRMIETRNLRIVLNKLADATLVESIDIPPVCRDPDDDKFLAAALQGAADVVVSEDADLLILGAYEGIVICPAEVMLQRLDQQSSR